MCWYTKVYKISAVSLARKTCFSLRMKYKTGLLISGYQNVDFPIDSAFWFNNKKHFSVYLIYITTSEDVGSLRQRLLQQMCCIMGWHHVSAQRHGLIMASEGKTGSSAVVSQSTVKLHRRPLIKSLGRGHVRGILFFPMTGSWVLASRHDGDAHCS